jgi:hypothetical protein
MVERTPRTGQYVDPDGVRSTETTGIRLRVWLLALAIALVGVAMLVVVRPALQPVPTTPGAARQSDLARGLPAPPVTAAPLKAAAAPPRRVNQGRKPQSESRVEPTPAPAPPPGAEESEAVQEEAPAEAASEQTREEPTGIGLFPPPGTKPIKRGIIVPEGIELPPGYVRHYQTTDDGRMLPAILMFHPDYHPVDERGVPIPLPEDRVVPPDMAPPDMPVQMLEVPQPGEPVPTGAPELGGRARDRARDPLDAGTR